FELDVGRKELRRAGRVVPIAPKPLELLMLLVRERDRVVSRAETLAAVWPDVRVSDATLASTVRDLRRALGDDAASPTFVETARGLGFRFVAPVDVRHARVRTSVAGDGPPFVGREDLLARLEDALATAVGGHGRVVVLEGEPGVGKTRALEAVAASARCTGALVGHARFPEAGAGPPYRPWGRLLEALVEARPPERLAHELGEGLPWIARLVPGLTATLGDPAASASEIGDPGARLRLFDAVGRFLRRVSRATPLALLLDDLQGADRSSLHLLEAIVEEIHDERVLIVATYRSCEVDSEHPLPATLEALARLPGYQRIRLEGVGPTATAALVAAATGREPDPACLAEIHARTDGNPFYVLELASYLTSEGGREIGRAHV